MRTHLFLLCFLSLATVSAQTYTNPVFDRDTPDPSIQRSQDGKFYCYATNCQTGRSSDLVRWTEVRDVFGLYIQGGKVRTMRAKM